MQVAWLKMITCLLLVGSVLWLVAVLAMGLLYLALDSWLCGNGSNEHSAGCKDFHAGLDVLVMTAGLFLVVVYFGCEFLCFLVAFCRERRAWDPTTSRKKLSMMFFQGLISEFKTIFIILFVWIYHSYDPDSHTGDSIAGLVIGRFPEMASLICLLVGLAWFFDLYLAMVLAVAAQKKRDMAKEAKDVEEKKTGNLGRFRRCWYGGSAKVIDEVAKDPGMQKQEYDKFFFAHMRVHHPLREPEKNAIDAVEEVLEGQHIEFIPCWVRKWNVSSIEEYLLLFTIFHVGLVSYNLILTKMGHQVDNQEFIQVYSMFPLGFFLGEKIMYIYTGFIPWWSEFLAMKKNHAAWVAWVGLVINVVDFLMVFFSIADDCLQLTNFPLTWTLALMLIDEVFDWIALLKKGMGARNDREGNSNAAPLLG